MARAKIETRIEKSYVESDLQAVVEFLTGVSQKIIDSTRNVDSQCNVLIGFSTGIFILAVNELIETDHFHLTLTVIAFLSALSAIIALCAVRPPKFLIKHGQEESLLYPRKISHFESAKEYSMELRRILKKDEDIFHQYAIEIYNLSKYYYLPKRKLFSLSRNIFLFGVIMSLVFLFLESTFNPNFF